MEKSIAAEGRNGQFKFILITTFGLLMFMLTIPALGETLFLYVIHSVQAMTASIIVPLLLIFLGINGLMSFLVTVIKLKPLSTYETFKKLFTCTRVKLIVNITAPLIVLFYYFQISPFIIKLSADVITMCTNIFVFLILAKMMLPFISDYGLAEFLEEMLNPFMRPIFKLPGSAIMAVVTSSFVSVTIAIILIADQFFKGYYNRRETILLITCLTLPAMPVTLLLTSLIGLSHVWGLFYLGITLIATLMSALMIRIPPLSKLSDEYYDSHDNLASNNNPTKITQKKPSLKNALLAASKRALEPHASPIENMVMVLKNMTSFIPFIIVYGTIAIFLIDATPFITWLTTPYGYYLSLFHIDEALTVAPALFLNTIDVILSPVILKTVQSDFTRFTMLLIFMDQMTYLAPFLLTMTIDGLVSLKTLFKIMVMRILLVVPIATLFAKIFF